jgi:rare lipoprotein A
MKVLKIILIVVFLGLAKLSYAAPIDSCAGVSFTGTLKEKSVGQEVKCLQIVLNLDKTTQIAKEGDGSPGKETDQFGKLTHAAVVRFQEKYAKEILAPANLKKGNGVVGANTRAKLNQILTEKLGDKKLKVAQTLEGKASYYANFFHGRKTSSGEIFDKNKYTAAHKTLPFGTKVRVVNQRNGRSVVVRINDRGPFIAGRVIDLSQIAARDIGLLSAGVANVKVHVLKQN